MRFERADHFAHLFFRGRARAGNCLGNERVDLRRIQASRQIFLQDFDLNVVRRDEVGPGTLRELHVRVGKILDRLAQGREGQRVIDLFVPSMAARLIAASAVRSAIVVTLSRAFMETMMSARRVS